MEIFSEQPALREVFKGLKNYYAIPPSLKTTFFQLVTDLGFLSQNTIDQKTQ